MELGKIRRYGTGPLSAGERLWGSLLEARPALDRRPLDALIRRPSARRPDVGDLVREIRVDEGQRGIVAHQKVNYCELGGGEAGHHQEHVPFLCSRGTQLVADIAAPFTGEEFANPVRQRFSRVGYEASRPIDREINSHVDAAGEVGSGLMKTRDAEIYCLPLWTVGEPSSPGVERRRPRGLELSKQTREFSSDQLCSSATRSPAGNRDGS